MLVATFTSRPTLFLQRPAVSSDPACPGHLRRGHGRSVPFCRHGRSVPLYYYYCFVCLPANQTAQCWQQLCCLLVQHLRLPTPHSTVWGIGPAPRQPNITTAGNRCDAFRSSTRGIPTPRVVPWTRPPANRTPQLLTTVATLRCSFDMKTHSAFDRGFWLCIP